MKYRISENVIRRLSRYLRRVDALVAAEREKISSGELGKIMGLTASQIRQDLNCFGGFGQQGYGYNVAQLRSGIQGALGTEKVLKAVVVGAGNLGSALITNFHFAECGVTLMAAFDVDPKLVGTKMGDTPIYHADTLENYIRENAVDLAVLTLSRTAAESTAELVAKCGVRGIWNFTGVDLDGRGALVENVHLSDSLLTLGYYVRSQTEEKEN